MGKKGNKQDINFNGPINQVFVMNDKASVVYNECDQGNTAAEQKEPDKEKDDQKSSESKTIAENSKSTSKRNEKKEENHEYQKGKKHKGKKGPSAWTKMIVKALTAIIVALIPVVVPYIVNNRATHTPSEQEQPVIQLFNNHEEIFETHTEYVRCTITSDPVISGYQVKVFPYLGVRKDEGYEYIPVLYLYNQEQYSADKDGVCTLIRENITDQIQLVIENELEMIPEEDYSLGSIVIIEYVSDNEEKKREALELRIGQLTVPNDEKIYKVLKAYEDMDRFIDVTAWPVSKDQLIEMFEKK